MVRRDGVAVVEGRGVHGVALVRREDGEVCAVPDGDFFAAMKRGRAEVVTDHIARFVPEGIELVSGRVLEADIVVTATGLQLLAFGGIQPTVDGQEVVLSDQFVWQGAMITGLPNFAICVASMAFARSSFSWPLREKIFTSTITPSMPGGQ